MPRAQTHLRVVLLTILIALSTGAGAQQTITLRTGQVGGVPGNCPSSDDSFHCYVLPGCSTPLSATPFSPSEFAAAQAGPLVQLSGAAGGWLSSLPADPQAHWINWQRTLINCAPTPGSALYACKFQVAPTCGPTASITACWACDDQLGDPLGNGPNTAGVYINGTPLNISGGSAGVQTCAAASSIPVNPGDNWLYVYVRDTNCGYSALLFSATITVGPSPQLCPSIGVTKFNDLNGNGVQDGGEPSISGWTINATGPATLSGVTGPDGMVLFRCIPPGTYKITEVTAPGWIQTAPPGGVNIVNAQCGADYVCSFGNRQCTNSGCLPPPACLRAWYPFDECSGVTAHETLASRNGTLIGAGGGPLWVPGVSGTPCALNFPATSGLASVTCPDAPELNFGTGSFSVSAWIKTTSSELDHVYSMMDKREYVLTPPSATPCGYHLYVLNGEFRLQYGEGNNTPYTTYVSTAPPVTDGAWHLVAVSVCRNPQHPEQNVAKLIVDQHIDTFTTGIPTGSLTTTVALAIGNRDADFNPAVFGGMIDEVKLYSCCLSDTQLLSLYTGQCGEYCSLPSVVSSALQRAISTLTIWNLQVTPQTYTWTISGLPSGSGCDVNGPTFFTPYSGSWTIPGAIYGPVCATIPITVIFPPGMSYGQTACYQVTVQNAATGACFGCMGRVRSLRKWYPVWLNTDLTLSSGQSGSALLRLHNTDDTPLSLEYALMEESADGEANNRIVGLNGLPPGVPVTGSLTVAPQDSADVQVGFMLTDFQPTNPHEIIFETDVDGDGVVDPIECFRIYSQPDYQTSGAAPPEAAASADPRTLLEAAPNPFLEHTGIRLSLGSAQPGVQVEVFDVGGRLVQSLYSGALTAGEHRFSWDGRDGNGVRGGSGLYFIRARAGGMSLMTKVLRIG